MDGSVTGDHLEDDTKIRGMGWGAYGERLRKKMDKKKKREDDDS